jgi:SulP family sulfate permease
MSLRFATPRWTLLLPFLDWLPLVNRKTLSSDLAAGLTGAIVTLPQGVAFATIAGMPPEYGLYAGMLPAIVAALFGSSWHLVSGPTTAASIVIFSSISGFAEPGSPEYVGLVLTLTLFVGLLELAMGLLRMGGLVSFISHTVVIGFTAGAAILIAANQVGAFLGFTIERGTPFYDVVVQAVTRIGEVDPPELIVGILTLAFGLGFKRYVPRIHYMLAALIAGSLAALAFNTVWPGAVTTMKALPAGLPPVSIPEVNLALIRELAPTVLAVTLFALTEAVSISRALAVRSEQQIDGNREFIGQGLSNIVGSFFSGYVATGSFNRSGINYAAGAKTPVAAISAGLMLMVLVVLVAPLAAYLPGAAMAAILFLVASGLIDVFHIREIIRTSRREAMVMITTFVCVLFLDLEIAILVGILLSLSLYLQRTSHPSVVVRVPDPESKRGKFTTNESLPECPQLKFIRIDGSLFFGAVPHVTSIIRALLQRIPTQKHLAIIASGINFMDVAGAQAISSEAGRLRRSGGALYLIAPKTGALASLARGGFIHTIGSDNIFFSKSDAITAIFDTLDRSICATCTARIFRECKGLPTAEVPDQPSGTSGEPATGGRP